ncbi:MAG: class I SAM-dependent methyltransferase [Chitinivibrionales bacterium]|nr:class I SAM-dependent methyltransferase [Chitinivibrionales bacterium]
MDRPLSNFSFRIMAWMLRKRDKHEFTNSFLSEIPLKEGDSVLDFGCGPGSFSIAASRQVGRGGHVYSVDIHPLALRLITKKINSQKLQNITTILTDCATGLSDESISVILFYDIFHLLSNTRAVFDEFYRLLTPQGILSFSDHHLQHYEISAAMTHYPYFYKIKTGIRTISYKKNC